MNILGDIPFVDAYLSASVSNVTGNGTAYTIIFDTVVGQKGTAYNASTGIYTVQVPGNYFISSNFLFNNLGTSGANNTLCNISINGVNYRCSEISTIAVKTSANTMSINLCLPCISMTVGQTINISAGVSNGSSPTVGITGGNSPLTTQLYITYLP